MRINWNEPRFGNEELENVSEVINTAYVNEGPKTKELEEEIKNLLNVKYVILTTNATAALFLAVKADSIIKNKPDFEVIVPDMSMIATATAVNWAGGKPRLVDVESENATIDWNRIEEKINEKTIAIIPVHILGRSANMDKINAIAKKYDLSVIEDAAGALGGKYNGEHLGTIGDVGCYSLQSNKIITCGQGGIIVTNNEKYYEAIRRLRDFGRLNNKEFLHNKVGYNLKFNDLSAALALSQFKRLGARKELLKKQKQAYKQELAGLKEVIFFKNKDEEVPLWIDVIVSKREELIAYLNEKDIYPRACWPAIHQNPPYQLQGDDGSYENSSFMAKNCLWLPNGPAITLDQIVFICQNIKEFYSQWN
jgi:perosamine synthetase